MAKDYRLYIPKNEFNNIKALLSNLEKIQTILEKVELSENLSSDLLENTISDVLDIKKIAAKKITNVLYNLSYALENLKMNEDILIDELITFCKDHNDELGEQIKIIEDKKNILKKLLNVNSPINIMRKSMELAISEKKIYKSSKIITDIRPVYNKDGTEILRMLIVNKLQLKYNENNRIVDDYIEMDIDDITELATNCERVLQKTSVLKEMMSKTDIPICLFGGNDE